MPKSTGWDTRRPWGNWRPPEVPEGPPPVWSARSVLGGAAALFVGTALVYEAYGFAEMATETPVPPDGVGRMLLVWPFLSCFGIPFALAGNLLVVLPVVWAARRVSGAVSGRDAWWWVPVAALLPAAALTAVDGLARQPGPGEQALDGLVAHLLITGAALCARAAALHGLRLRRILGYGGLAAVAVFGVGGIAYGTGLLTEYRPPKVNAAQLAGIWRDGRGGTLRLAADGTARAEGLTDHESAYEDNADADRAKYRCTGPGAWVYDPGTPRPGTSA